MKLSDLISFVHDPHDMVSVYDTTENDWYRTLYEGPMHRCHDHLMDREVCSIYAASEFEGMLCIGLHNDLEED